MLAIYLAYILCGAIMCFAEVNIVLMLIIWMVVNFILVLIHSKGVVEAKSRFMISAIECFFLFIQFIPIVIDYIKTNILFCFIISIVISSFVSIYIIFSTLYKKNMYDLLQQKLGNDEVNE